MLVSYKLNSKGIQDVDYFKNVIAKAINQVATLMPDGRDKSLFLTKIEEASFFGTKAISGSTSNYDDVVTYPINNG